MFRKTISAIDRPSFGRLEWDITFFLAVGAGRFVHLARGHAPWS